MRALAAQSSIMKASSGPVRRKFSGTKIAPSRAEANMDEEEHRLVVAEKGDAIALRHSDRGEPAGAVLDLALHLAVGPVAALEMQRPALGRA